jgi:PAS domain S-box-containing protein
MMVGGEDRDMDSAQGDRPTEPTQVLVPIGAVRASAWFFENSLDVFLGIEAGVLRRTNATWTALTGWGAQETADRSFSSFVHPDDAEAARVASAGLGVGERSVHDHRIATKTGGWVWVRNHSVGGEAGWLLTILRDIGLEREREALERQRERESEEARHVAAMLRDTAGVTVWRYNPDTDEYDVNPDYTKPVTTGSAEAARLVGDGVRRSIHRQDAPALLEAWTRSLTTGEPGRMEYRERTGAEAWRNIRAAWRGLRRLPSGRWEMLGIAEDVTALVEARDAARRGEQAALAAMEAKGRFLANMSHELRTPMNGVLGILHMLEAEPPRRERQRLLREALSCGVGLSDLLGDIVDYSDVEGGRIDILATPLDPAAELQSVLALLKPAALAKGLAVETTAMADLGWVQGDPARLRKMCFHLIGNAVKFTSQGRVGVALSASGETQRRRLRLEVTDTGIGVSAGAQRQLFRQFSQADGSSTRRFGGPGLGLAVTKGLAELMGGEVGFETAEGQGSLFWFEIAAPACAPPKDVAASDTGWLSGLRVLVVEDNPTNRLVAQSMLGELGAEVEVSEDGAQGVAAVQRSHFDLIFMDIQMPVMDGVEATRRIRAMAEPKCFTPIVATTANVMPEQLLSYRRSGIDGVVPKPISPRALIAEIARVAAAANDSQPQTLQRSA